MLTISAHAAIVSTAVLCAALAVPRATFYRAQLPPKARQPRRASPRALSAGERATVLAALHEPRFADLSPTEVYATLLDEGRHLCSERTMYRILAENSEIRERRDQLVHPPRTPPQHHATAPNQLWSWDITKLPGPMKWTYFHLYVIIDVFSRFVVGWMVAHRESAVLAQKLIQTTSERQGIQPGQLTIHADNGASMTSKPVAFLLEDLGVAKTHSRPYVSNDNPYSEAHFKTLKYRPDFPDRFAHVDDSRGFLRDFFSWYNDEHHHSGLALLTPHDVHHGLAQARLEARAVVLAQAYAQHPERFPQGFPRPSWPPTEVWINKPSALDGELADGSAQGPSGASTSQNVDAPVGPPSPNLPAISKGQPPALSTEVDLH